MEGCRLRELEGRHDSGSRNLALAIYMGTVTVLLYITRSLSPKRLFSPAAEAGTTHPLFDSGYGGWEAKRE